MNMIAQLSCMPPEYDVVIERDPEGLYIATVPALYGCRSEARSLDELMLRMREAILLRLTIEGSDPDDLEFVGIHRLRMA
jgi:predicted RNase H-like HicB family nuclease